VHGSGVVHFENTTEGTETKPVFSQVQDEDFHSNESLVFMTWPVVRMQLKNTFFRMAAANFTISNTFIESIHYIT
jgi:hypothetical protein